MSKLEELEECAGQGGNKSSVPRAIREKQYINWFFTFNNYKEYFGRVEELENILDKISFKYVFQEEKGKTTGTEHLQGLFSVKQAKGSRMSELLKKINIHKEKEGGIYLEPLKKLDAAAMYCQKTETKNGRTFAKGVIVLDILNESDFYPWQKQIKEIISEKPDNRSVYWIFDKTGNTGKSSFCKYLLFNKLAIVCQGGKKSDIINLIYNNMTGKSETGINIKMPKCIIWDLPRSNEGKISWDCVECIKNGMITNTKYECGTLLFNAPHLFIFSNYPPIFEGQLSLDRWRIYEIDESKNLSIYGTEKSTL